jgi:hypothetical protein
VVDDVEHVPDQATVAVRNGSDVDLFGLGRLFGAGGRVLCFLGGLFCLGRGGVGAGGCGAGVLGVLFGLAGGGAGGFGVEFGGGGVAGGLGVALGVAGGLVGCCRVRGGLLVVLDGAGQ